MSSTNFVGKMLDGVEIDWKPLGELTLPTSNIKWREVNRTHRYIDLTSVSIETKKIAETSLISASNAPSRAQKIVKKGDLIFATTRPAQQRYCLIEGEYSGEIASTGYCVLRAKSDEVLPKWILHWIASDAFKTYVEENQSGSAYPAISDAKVKEFEIPIPCPQNPKKSLEIQAEIVRILDAFTELTTELTTELATELATRKKQYNYYRDKLLSFGDEEVEWETLGEVATFANGKGHEKDIVEHGRYVVVNSKFVSTGGKVTKFTDRQICPLFLDDVLIVMSDLPYGKTLAKTFIVDEDNKYSLNQRIGSISVKNQTKLLPKFLHYFLNRTPQLVKFDNGTDQTNLRKDQILNVLVPVPPIFEQKRIVAVIDKFDVLINSLSEGLPKEIKLRQKQYEHYRDLLLSFPRAKDVTA
jgi:type I restriction enzyme, S subunit